MVAAGLGHLQVSPLAVLCGLVLVRMGPGYRSLRFTTKGVSRTHCCVFPGAALSGGSLSHTKEPDANQE